MLVGIHIRKRIMGNRRVLVVVSYLMVNLLLLTVKGVWMVLLLWMWTTRWVVGVIVGSKVCLPAIGIKGHELLCRLC